MLVISFVLLFVFFLAMLDAYIFYKFSFKRYLFVCFFVYNVVYHRFVAYFVKCITLILSPTKMSC